MCHLGKLKLHDKHAHFWNQMLHFSWYKQIACSWKMFEHDQPITTEIHLKTKNNTHTKLLLTTWDYTNDANIFHHKSFNSIKSFALSGKRYKTKIDFFLFCLIIKKKNGFLVMRKYFFFYLLWSIQRSTRVVQFLVW